MAVFNRALSLPRTLTVPTRYVSATSFCFPVAIPTNEWNYLPFITVAFDPDPSLIHKGFVGYIVVPCCLTNTLRVSWPNRDREPTKTTYHSWRLSLILTLYIPAPWQHTQGLRWQHHILFPLLYQHNEYRDHGNLFRHPENMSIDKLR